MNHIRGFARGLGARGIDCAVAIPDNYEETRGALEGQPPFRPVLFSDCWKRIGELFADGQSADVIHAWTPREHVRRAVARAREVMPAADLVVHLEDNEQHLSEAFTHSEQAQLRHLSDAELSGQLPLNLAHPRKSFDFLRAADGITGIVSELTEFAPRGVPFAELWPIVDFAQYHPAPPDDALREALGIRPEEKVICYNGNSHFANGAEMASLYEAVFLLNERGIACRLVRTGLDAADFSGRFAADALARHVLHLGFVDQARLPDLLRLADVLVQPGENNKFNSHRLPSKLPEFLATGRPVVMPRVNLGTRVRAGEEALLLETGRPTEIADCCAMVFSRPDLAARLSTGAAAFARRHFDLETNSRRLAEFYDSTCVLWRREPRSFSLVGAAAA